MGQPVVLQSGRGGSGYFDELLLKKLLRFFTRHLFRHRGGDAVGHSLFFQSRIQIVEGAGHDLRRGRIFDVLGLDQVQHILNDFERLFGCDAFGHGTHGDETEQGDGRDKAADAFDQVISLERTSTLNRFPQKGLGTLQVLAKDPAGWDPRAGSTD